jgi:diadenosine tetraphosphatase ApaH/serine/threonine PP2A family protein phosphatase
VVDWFPRPASVADVEVLGPGDLDAGRLFELLTVTDAEEWRHKVGVAGRADGSGKPSTRLLSVGGWVLKTDVAAPAPARAALRTHLLAQRARGLRAGVWHPSKQWSMAKTELGWLPVFACRQLRTLRTVEPLSARMDGWTRMIAMGLEVHARCGLGLDLNPANFALDDALMRLFYLDDELYETLGSHQLAVAIASRIPEEPDATDEVIWADWGRSLRRALPLSQSAKTALAESIVDYPHSQAFHGRRAALLAGLMEEPPAVLPERARPRGEIVCVLADVHGNLPALEAVLGAARERGATSYLFLGDAVGYGPHPRECVQVLAELGATLVGGNHDHAIATETFDAGMNRLARACAAWTRASLGPAELAWLAALPREHREDGWMAVHGAPRDPHRFLAYVYELTYEDNLRHLRDHGIALCFHGHTHVQMVHATLPSGPTKLPARDVDLPPGRPHLVNPGSVGQPRDGDPRAAYALWDRTRGHVLLERVAYCIDDTLRDIARADLPPELAARLRQGT